MIRGVRLQMMFEDFGYQPVVVERRLADAEVIGPAGVFVRKVVTSERKVYFWAIGGDFTGVNILTCESSGTVSRTRF